MKYQTKIDKVVRFIMKRPDEELAALSVARLADIFHIERTTLAREFKFHREVTLEYYLTREKIMRAAFLLVYEVGISIGQVAERMGFCSCQYFSRVFEKFFGIKPCKYMEYQQMRCGGKERKEVATVTPGATFQRSSVVLSRRRKNSAHRRQVVKDRPRNIVERMPILPVEPMYPAYSIQGLLRMMRENETA